MEARRDRFAELEERLAGYQVCDRSGTKVGKVDDLFVDDLNDCVEYISVRTGFFGFRRTLIPADALQINDTWQLIEIFQPKDKVEDAPHFDDYGEITAEFEWQVRSYFGLESAESTIERYPGVALGDVECEQAQFYEYLPSPNTGSRPDQRTASGPRDEDELRVQRTQETLHADTRRPQVRQ